MVSWFGTIESISIRVPSFSSIKSSDVISLVCWHRHVVIVQRVPLITMSPETTSLIGLATIEARHENAT